MIFLNFTSSILCSLEHYANVTLVHIILFEIELGLLRKSPFHFFYYQFTINTKRSKTMGFWHR